MLAWFPDQDNDGYGVKEGSKHSCNQPAGFSASSADCDDTDPEMNPGEDEVCDGKNNDCDGQIDEGNVCKDCVQAELSDAKLCKIATYKMPTDNPLGLTWVSTTGEFWVLGTVQVGDPVVIEGKMYRVNAQGKVVQTLAFPAMLPRDITFDGQSLWATSVFTNQIFKLSLTGKTLNQFAMKNNQLPSGIARMGNISYVAANVALMQTGFQIWKYSGGTNFTNPINHDCGDYLTCYIHGMTARDGKLWHIQTDGTLRKRSTAWKELDRFQLVGGPLTENPVGVAWDGTYFWVTESLVGKLHKFAFIE